MISEASYEIDKQKGHVAICEIRKAMHFEALRYESMTLLPDIWNRGLRREYRERFLTTAG